VNHSKESQQFPYIVTLSFSHCEGNGSLTLVDEA